MLRVMNYNKLDVVGDECGRMRKMIHDPVSRARLLLVEIAENVLLRMSSGVAVGQ